MEAYLALQQRAQELELENDELKNREQALGEALRFHGFTFEFAEDGSLKCGSENAAMEELARRALTPEMRERMGALLLAFDEGFLEMEEAALNGINIIRGLLGEQG